MLYFATNPKQVNGQSLPLDMYLAEGMENNLTLQSQQYSVEQSLKALGQAKGMFLPDVNIEARYSRAGGGRQIEFPIGDLLNPVYSTLNDMLQQQGQPGVFPQLDNQEIDFLREREQESKVRIIQPVFQPAILHNYKLHQHLASSQEAALYAYRNVLQRDIKVAYYNYLKAQKATQIFDAARLLVDENLRVNERLIAHDKATQDALYRAETEVLAVSQQQREAQKNSDLAKSYFNFLLNRSLEEDIEVTEEELLMASVANLNKSWGNNQAPALILAAAELDSQKQMTRKTFEHIAVQNRQELEQIDASIRASEAGVKIARSAFLPSVGLAVDLGIQGAEYGFTGDQSFYMASVVLSWNLFNGFQNRSKLQSAQIETQKLQSQREALHKQIELQTREAYDNLEVAMEMYQMAEKRVRAAGEGYRLVSRKYEEGMANQISFLDARTTLTEADINLNLTRYDVLIRMAELEYAAAIKLSADQ